MRSSEETAEMRKRGKIDSNHSEIVQALRQIGATVQSLASVGNGCPDLLVGFRGINVLLEIKSGRRYGFTDAETKWNNAWRGLCCVACTKEQAIAHVVEITESVIGP